MSPKTSRKPPRVLIAEDELIVAADVANWLTRLGYDVVGGADRGDEAVRLAGELRPDLVLMDVRLGGEMDGVTAAEIIRRRFHLPVVFLTAHSDEATLQRAKETEPFGYVLKPFEERELRTAIEIALYKHQAERRLSESERRYAATLAGIGEGVLATDSPGVVSYLNPVAENLTGWTASDAIGMPIAEVLRLVDEQTRRPVKIDEEGGPRADAALDASQDFLLLARDGRERPVKKIATCILDDEGNSSGVVVVFRDVSAERRREEELRHSQKMEVIGRLAAGVAHDFNNLLNIIIGHCSLMMESTKGDEALRESVAEIAQAGEMAVDLTRRLLTFGRKQLFQPRVIDLNAVVADGVRMLRRLIRENIELSIDLAPGPLMIKADPSQIGQAIVNLAVNARDAMPCGGRLSLTTRLHNGPQNPAAAPGAELRVSDTGIGMDASTLARVWEPFFTTKEVGRGAGLGLPSVRDVVEQSGGTVAVESELGRGSTFTILLPLTTEAPAEAATPSSEETPTGAETILVVEDFDPLRMLYSHSLRRAGYNVLEARHGGEALELAERRREPIDLLVTDLMMPQMSGQALASVLGSRRAGMRTLFVSGLCEADLRDVVAPGEPLHLLQKPISPKALAEKVREVLDAT